MLGDITAAKQEPVMQVPADYLSRISSVQVRTSNSISYIVAPEVYKGKGFVCKSGLWLDKMGSVLVESAEIQNLLFSEYHDAPRAPNYGKVVVSNLT